MENLTAVVTGGTRGIGLGIGEALLKRGASLAITYLSNDEDAGKAILRLEEQADPGCKVILLKGDCGDSDTVRAHYQKVCEKLGPPNVLVNNAGIMFQRSFEEISFEDWDQTIRINLSGSFYWLSLAVGAMKKQGFGRVVNISSIAARGGGVVGPHYASSKAGQLGMTRYAARELAPYGITVNAIAPAFIEDAGIFTSWGDAQKQALKQKVYTPRLGRVHDVVQAFEYLLDTGFVTGVTLDLNGGAFVI